MLLLEITGLRFGMIGLLCMVFLFLPISRGSILLRLIDIPFEHATRYHVWLGHITMAFFSLHGLCYVVAWTIEGRLLELVRFHKKSFNITIVLIPISFCCFLYRSFIFNYLRLSDTWMESHWNCGLTGSYQSSGWFTDVGHVASHREKALLWALLLHPSTIHCLCRLLGTSRWWLLV